MLGLVSHPYPPPRLYLLHLVDPVEEVPVMVGQLACQVLGTHEVQHLRRTQSGPQLLRVWGLQEKKTQGGPGTKILPVVRGTADRHSIVK